MANGYYLARNGFINQRSAQGVGSARNLIMAAKQSGHDAGDEDHYGATGIGDALIDHLMKVKGPELEERLALSEGEFAETDSPSLEGAGVKD